jgi:DNA-directed RNA polymerase subunit RPC12/RpoP
MEYDCPICKAKIALTDKDLICYECGYELNPKTLE